MSIVTCPICNNTRTVERVVDPPIWLCRKCSSTTRPRKPHSEETKKKIGNGNKNKTFSEETRKKMSESGKVKVFSPSHREALSIKFSGANNPMHGISLFEKWKEKYGEKEAIEREKTRREKTSKNNARPMSGRSVFSVWKEKYGEEIAEEKMKILKQKISLSSKGKRNPMYGISPPKGSGRGWSGWYLGNYFRSLLELSFILQCEEREISWISAEDSKFQVNFSLEGESRTYRPDFYLPLTEEVVEIKPSQLETTKLNQAKFEAAKRNFIKFRVLTEKEIPYVTEPTLKKLREEGKLVLSEKWNKKLI